MAPWLTGFLLARTGHFAWAFFIPTAVVCLGAVSWVFIVGPIKPIDWMPHPLVA